MFAQRRRPSRPKGRLRIDHSAVLLGGGQVSPLPTSGTLLGDMSESYSRAANLLGALSLALSERIGRAAGPDGLSSAGSRAGALVTLLHHPDPSIDDLAGTLGLTHSGAVRLVDRLEGAGLVRRAVAGRGRTLALRLTANGSRAARAVLTRRQAGLEPLLARLESDERLALESACERLLAEVTTDRRSAHHICRLCDESVCERGAACPVDVAAG